MLRLRPKNRPRLQSLPTVPDKDSKKEYVEGSDANGNDPDKASKNNPEAGGHGSNKASKKDNEAGGNGSKASKIDNAVGSHGNGSDKASKNDAVSFEGPPIKRAWVCEVQALAQSLREARGQTVVHERSGKRIRVTEDK